MLNHTHKILGGILLIVGTSIGGGMLALPIANALPGFPISTALLTLCWALMTAGAYFILEVNLYLPQETNLISMARATLGPLGAGICWLVTLSLLYSLLSAYIAGGTDVFAAIVRIAQLPLSEFWTMVLFVGLLGTVVILGIRYVDFVNTGLMFGKLGVYLILVAMLIPHITPTHLHGSHLQHTLTPTMILITSFGYAVLIPSLRTYLQDDVQHLRTVILIGSLIPLVCYILWDAVVMGVIPRAGPGNLLELHSSGHQVAALTVSLSNSLRNPWITELFRLFTSICMLTAFLGVALSLKDFLADGLQLPQRGIKSVVLYGLVFLPPMVVVRFFTNAFLRALDYAGIMCVILLMLLPALMVYRGRYVLSLPGAYHVRLRRGTILTVIGCSVLLLITGISQLITGY